MLQKPRTYYLSALLILVAIIAFPVREYAAFLSGKHSGSPVHEWPQAHMVMQQQTPLPNFTFFMIAVSVLFLVIAAIAGRKLKPQLITGMIAALAYGLMLGAIVVTLFFDSSYVTVDGKELPKPSSAYIALSAAFIGWILVFIGNRKVIQHIKLLDSQNRLR